MSLSQEDPSVVIVPRGVELFFVVTVGPGTSVPESTDNVRFRIQDKKVDMEG